MKKIILISIILILGFSTGCGSGYFVLPDDSEFLALFEELDTPEKICQYIEDNFTYKFNIFDPLTPYQLYLSKKGDCDDFSNFAVFFADHHNYETWQIKIYYKDTFFRHFIAIYKENGKYNFSDNQYYIFIETTSFKEIVEYDCYLRDKIWTKYTVYNYDMNIVETGYNN